MPKLLRFVFKNVLLGVLVGWSFVAALLYFDVGGIGTLVLNSSSKYAALGLLLGGFGVTFGSASVATAVLLGHDFIEDNNDKDDADKALIDTTELKLVPHKIEKR